MIRLVEHKTKVEYNIKNTDMPVSVGAYHGIRRREKRIENQMEISGQRRLKNHSGSDDVDRSYRGGVD